MNYPVGEQTGVPNLQTGMLKNCQLKLDAEDDEGWVEYKWRLTSIAPQRFEHLVTQMKFRVAEGHGQCVYEIGVDDDGYPKGLNPADFEESLDTVRRMATKLNFDVKLLYERVVSTAPVLLRCAELQVTKFTSEYQDLRIACSGPVDAGKSTLVGVLAHGLLDDGAGASRQYVFNHKHELNTGRTSSLSEKVIGFDSKGNVTNYEHGNNDDSNLDASPFVPVGVHGLEETISERSVKLVTLMDLAGHDKYSKTTISGFTSKPPGYACVVGSFRQPVDNLLRYLQFCHSLRIPFFIVLNKADAVSKPDRESFLLKLEATLDQLHCKHLVIHTEEDALAASRIWQSLPPRRSPSPQVQHSHTDSQLSISDRGSPGPTPLASTNTVDSVHLTPNTPHPPDGQSPTEATSTEAFPMTSTQAQVGPNISSNAASSSGERRSTSPQQETVPLFSVSCVSGAGISLLKRFLHFLPAVEPQSHLPAEALVSCFMQVPRVGTVIGAYVTKGMIQEKDTLWIGPDRRGAFYPTVIASIRHQGNNVKRIAAGAEGTFAIQEGKLPEKIDVNRKGTVLIQRPVSSNSHKSSPPPPSISLSPVTSPTTRVFGSPTTIPQPYETIGVATEFEAEVSILSNDSVQQGAEPICHSRNLRQAVKILHIVTGVTPTAHGANPTGPTVLHKGQTGIVQCKFLYHPEVLDLDGVVVFHANRKVQMIGNVTRLYPLSPSTTVAVTPQVGPEEDQIMAEQKLEVLALPPSGMNTPLTSGSGPPQVEGTATPPTATPDDKNSGGGWDCLFGD